MKANFRQVFVFNCDVETRSSQAVLPSMRSLIEIWTKYWKNGEAYIDISGDDGTILIGDIVRDTTNSMTTILIRHSDRAAANSIYSDPKANTYTRHAKKGREGGETGVHVFISDLQEKGEPNRYTILIEKSTGLDRLLIRRLLNDIIHREYKVDQTSFSFPSPVGQKDRAGNIVLNRCLPRIEVEGRPSVSFAKDVAAGRVGYVTLVRSEAGIAVGAVPALVKQEASLRLKVDQGSVGANIWGDIKKVMRNYAKDYPSARVSFTLPGKRRGVSVKVDATNGALLDEAYVKSHDFVGIFPPLDTSSQKVVAHLAGLALPVLLSERNV